MTQKHASKQALKTTYKLRRGGSNSWSAKTTPFDESNSNIAPPRSDYIRKRAPKQRISAKKRPPYTRFKARVLSHPQRDESGINEGSTFRTKVLASSHS